MNQDRIPRELYEGMVERARDMRLQPTKAEAKLWKHLKKRRIGGLRFRRQHVIHSYIVDFFCHDANLIIEIDGPIHEKQQDYDLVHQEDLTSLGYQVHRFTNQQVMEDIDSVLNEIRKFTPD